MNAFKNIDTMNSLQAINTVSKKAEANIKSAENKIEILRYAQNDKNIKREFHWKKRLI